jgi:predicted enzyme related to lactoylglutathione lyase
MGTLASIVIDCADPTALAAFWAEAVGYRYHGDVEQYAVLVPAEGEKGPMLLLQRVDEAKAAKNRVHVDVGAADVDAEADRLVAIGATRTGAGNIGDHRWIVLADPEGNEFCVCSE